ncbi:hypothetical protein STEG23_026917 [Scotinomys teguina]
MSYTWNMNLTVIKYIEKMNYSKKISYQLRHRDCMPVSDPDAGIWEPQIELIEFEDTLPGALEKVFQFLTKEKESTLVCHDISFLGLPHYSLFDLGTMEYYAAEKNNDFIKFGGKWMELENVNLSEVYFSRSTSLYCLPQSSDMEYINGLDIVNIMEFCLNLSNVNGLDIVNIRLVNILSSQNFSPITDGSRCRDSQPITRQSSRSPVKEGEEGFYDCVHWVPGIEEMVEFTGNAYFLPGIPWVPDREIKGCISSIKEGLRTFVIVGTCRDKKCYPLFYHVQDNYTNK